ncbi:MAG: hypothetical protein PVH37_22490, partial [Desulfobacterales bacterium]
YKRYKIESQETSHYLLHFGMLNTKAPNPIKEMGLYNSTMAHSSGFTNGLNVDNLFFSIRLYI